jgi:diaminopimelate decarboxylase
LIRPAIYHSYHEIVPVNGSAKSREATHQKIDIVGPVCESGDFFAIDRMMPELHEGDLLAIMSAGAYGFVMASNYNSRPFPAEILVEDAEYRLVRKRQCWDDLVRDEQTHGVVE